VSASSVYDIATVPGEWVGENGVIGDTVGEMGDVRMSSSDVTAAWSVSHHLLVSCLPDILRLESFVPCGLAICPSQYRPCFLS
jgi:hypothetical protein